MTGILGKKIGMTRLIEENGHVTPVTLIQCLPNTITQIKTKEKDGYSAVVVGFDELKHPKKTKKFKTLKEFKISEEQEKEFKKGDIVDLKILEELESITITGYSKGKGFQGGIKRHNFSRGPESHGSHHHRRTGSVGACTKPGRVHKGKKMPGHMGNEKTTLRKVKIALLQLDKNLICLKGSVPGANGSTVYLRTY